jgi:peptidoglycan LD-endopeptidase CwlK
MPTFHDLDGNVTLGPCRARLASWSDVHETPAGDAPSRSDPLRQPVTAAAAHRAVRGAAMALVVCFLRLGLVVACYGLVPDALAKHKPGARSPAVSNSPRSGPGDVYANIPDRDEFGRDQLAMFRAWNSDPVGNHAANLKAINPALAKVIRKAQADNPRLRFVISSGKRGYDMQQKAVAWGWSNTWNSRHRSGDAVDLWPLDAKGRINFVRTTQIRVAAAMKKAAKKLRVSIHWGGSFHGFKDMDRSHFELTAN